MVLSCLVADKLDWDNVLRMCTEVHVCLTISVALVFRTDLDVEMPDTLSGTHEPDASKYHLEVQNRKDSYDWLLLSTFVVCVPGCVAFLRLTSGLACGSASAQT
eukprot:COSAG02_NODE_5331_length_4431_cov_4.370729_4_plen_104_part_00